MEMACRTLEAGNYRLTDEAHRCLASLIEKASAQRDEYFGNGRWVHNLINQVEAERNFLSLKTSRISSPRPKYSLFRNRTLLSELLTALKYMMWKLTSR